MRKFTSIIACMLAPLAFADSVDERIRHGHANLRAGNIDEALAEFEELRESMPELDEMELIDYSIACAEYERAVMQLEQNEIEVGRESMANARQQFEGLLSSTDDYIRVNAQFNAANSTAYLAKTGDRAKEFKETVQAYVRSIEGYESVLFEEPGHEQAALNRNHMRYELKELLQQPRQENEDEQSPDEDGDQGDDQQPQDQQGEQGDEPPEGEDSEEESSDEGDDQEEPDDSESENERAGEGDEQKGDMTQSELSRQNIEAILQSLEDINGEEQKNLRKDGRTPKANRGEWW